MKVSLTIAGLEIYDVDPFGAKYGMPVYSPIVTKGSGHGIPKNYGVEDSNVWQGAEREGLHMLP